MQLVELLTVHICVIAPEDFMEMGRIVQVCDFYRVPTILSPGLEFTVRHLINPEKYLNILVASFSS